MKLNKHFIGLLFALIGCLTTCLLICGMFNIRRNLSTLHATAVSDFAVNLKIGETELRLTPQQHKMKFDVNSLNSEKDIVLQFTNISPGLSIKVNGQEPDQSGRFFLKLDSLRRDDVILISVLETSSGKMYEFGINAVNSNFPLYRVVGKADSGGNYYFDLFSQLSNEKSFIAKMDSTGHLLYYRCSDVPIMNFTKLQFDNKVSYSYFEADKFETAPIGYIYGDVVVMDEQYSVINRIRMEIDDTISNRFPVENHEYLFIEQDHYILSTYFPEIVHNIQEEESRNLTGNKVCATYIQEIKAGEVVWSWDSTQHPEFYNLSQENNDFTNKTSAFPDYMHLNSMAIDPKDHNLICSFRNLDSIVKIDRLTGAVVWILGGVGDQFGLKAEQKFSRQHYAQVSQDGALTLFDNGNANQKSRILKMRLNESTKSLLSYEEISIPGRYSPWGGSAQFIEDTSSLMVAWAGNQPHESDWAEIDSTTGKVRFEVFFDGSVNTYRCIKIAE